MTAARERVIGSGNGGDCGDLVAQCAGDAICHTTAEGPAGDVDAVGVNAVVLFQKTEHIAGELYVVGVTCWAIGTYACIPRIWGIDALWEDQDEACSVCLGSHISILSHILS